MEYQQKMVIPTFQPYKQRDDNDDDDEDLEALRLAALKSLKAKNTSGKNVCDIKPTSSQPFVSYNQRTIRKKYYQQNSPLQRQNGNIYYPSRNNQNLIEIVPVEENTNTNQQKEEHKQENDLVGNENLEGSKFCRFNDNISGTDDEESESKSKKNGQVQTVSEVSTEKVSSKTKLEEPEVNDEEKFEEEDEFDDELELEDDEELEIKPDVEEKIEDDDDDILLMADHEEEDSLERLMNEMEKEINMDKPMKKEKKSCRREKERKNTKSNQAIPEVLENCREFKSYNRVNSPFMVKRKKSPSRQVKNRDVRYRSRSPRSRKRSKSPRHLRSDSHSPQNSPKLRTPKLSPRVSPHKSSPKPSRMSPRRRRSPSPPRKVRRSPTPEEVKESAPNSPKAEVKKGETNPILEARRRKFETVRVIDPINDNKKIKLSKKEDVEDVNEEKVDNLDGDSELSENCTPDNELDRELSDESLVSVDAQVKVEKERSKKKKKKDKEIYQVGKLKELPLSERIGKDKKCRKRKDVHLVGENVKNSEIKSDDAVEDETDLRAELSRRRAERLNRNAPIQSARLLQSAFKGVVNDVVKNNAKMGQKHLKSDDKSSQKDIRRVTLLHRSVSDIDDNSEDESIIDSKVPVRYRLGINKPVQEIKESSASRKSSKRQIRKESKKY